jgi:hypothetical protein
MGRKTVFFFSRHLIYILKQSALERLGQQGAFKYQALWSVRAGKGLNLIHMRLFDHKFQN